MKAERRGGDSYTDRLFQWLQKEEKLPISLVRTIKPKIYEVKCHNKRFILKGYRRSHILFQQIEFFKEWKQASYIGARPQPFPDDSYSKSKLGCEWGLFEWIGGRHADFSRTSDREICVGLLGQFHRTTKGITAPSLPKDPLYIKWERRLEQFEGTRNLFYDYRKVALFDDLALQTWNQLKKFSAFPWGAIEEESWEKQDWLHGDVAHHNFILDQNKQGKLIDFDLLHVGPRVYDDIQLGQRFLPFVESQRSALFPYFKHVDQQKIWLQGILVPADLLREWLYGYRRCQREEASITHHLRKLENAWESRKKFVRYTENML